MKNSSPITSRHWSGRQYKKSDFKENEKHSEVRWISREEVDTFKEDTVKDFKNTLKLAFAKMEEMYGNTDE